MSTVLDRMAKSAYTWNGALSYSTTGTGPLGAVLDYWAKAGTYQARPQGAVDEDMVKIFNDDEKTALAVLFGLRLITRKPNNVTGIEDAQTGYGRKDEFGKGFNWLLDNRRSLALDNLRLIPVFGSWKDFFVSPLLERLDIRTSVYVLMRYNLGDSLLRKYLPHIYSPGKKQNRKLRYSDRVISKTRNKSPRSVQLTAWAKGFCVFLGINEAEYRRLKRDGDAHTWQKQMVTGDWDNINFKGIPGKAMLWHTSRRGRKDQKNMFERHNQVQRLTEWVLQQPMVKFTGYPHELAAAARSYRMPYQATIYDRQFETILEPMKNHKLGNVLIGLDTSGSMEAAYNGVRAIDICTAMGVCFSRLNIGYFKDAVAMFDSTSRILKLAGGFCERLKQIPANAMGSTNFQSLIDLLCQVRKDDPGIPLNEYPETILVISDMQFNPVGDNMTTNYEAAMAKLRAVGLSAVRIIWWTVAETTKDFPAQMNDKGAYLISGFDPINIKALMGLTSQPKDDAPAKEMQTPLDGLKNFLNQPIFNLLKV
jgi:Domain of unknown function (DUF2828)